MKFSVETLKQVFIAIENKLEYVSSDVNSARGFDLHCSIKAEDVINANPYGKPEETRYCLAILRQIGYIKIENGVINTIAPSCYKFICESLHGVNFKY